MPGQQFKCKFCEDLFGDLIQFKIHLGLKHNNENFSEDDLIKEMIQTLKANPKQSGDMTMMEKLEAHIREVDEPRPISMICDACGRTFEDQLVMKKHMKNHVRHMKSKLKNAENEGQRFQCHLCPSNYKLASYLAKHMKIHTGKALSCPECTRTFYCSSGLKEHTLTHSGEKPFSCHLCDKKFRRNSEFQVHLKLHSGELDFSCKTCGRKFEVKRALKIHELTHTEERAYKCFYCDEKFKSHPSRSSHIHTCHLERSFICDICDEGYPSKSALFVHLRCHKKNYPHKCEACSMRFMNPLALEQHELLHQQGMTLFCEICEEGFNDRTQANLHHKERHKGVPRSVRDYDPDTVPGPNDAIGQAIFLTASTDEPDSMDTNKEDVTTLDQPSSSTMMQNVDKSDISENELNEQMWEQVADKSLEQVLIKTEPECIISEGSVEPGQVMIKQEPD